MFVPLLYAKQGEKTVSNIDQFASAALIYLSFRRGCVLVPDDRRRPNIGICLHGRGLKHLHAIVCGLQHSLYAFYRWRPGGTKRSTRHHIISVIHDKSIGVLHLGKTHGQKREARGGHL